MGARALAEQPGSLGEAQVQSVLALGQDPAFQANFPAPARDELTAALRDFRAHHATRAQQHVVNALHALTCAAPALEKQFSRGAKPIPQEFQIQSNDSPRTALMKLVAVAHPDYLKLRAQAEVRSRRERFRTGVARSLKMELLEQEFLKKTPTRPVPFLPELNRRYRVSEAERRARLDAAQAQASGQTLEALLKEPALRKAWEDLKRTGDGRESGFGTVSDAFGLLEEKAGGETKLAFQLLENPVPLDWLEARSRGWFEDHQAHVRQAQQVDPVSEDLSRKFALGLKFVAGAMAEDGARGKIRQPAVYASGTLGTRNGKPISLNDFSAIQAKYDAMNSQLAAVWSVPRAVAGVTAFAAAVTTGQVELLPLSLALMGISLGSGAVDLAHEAATRNPRKAPSLRTAAQNIQEDASLKLEIALYVIPFLGPKLQALVRSETGLLRWAKSVHPGNPAAFARAFRAAEKGLRISGHSYFTFQAAQGLAQASRLCAEPDQRVACWSELSLALMNALPQGVETYRALKPKAQACRVPRRRIELPVVASCPEPAVPAVIPEPVLQSLEAPISRLRQAGTKSKASPSQLELLQAEFEESYSPLSDPSLDYGNVVATMTARQKRQALKEDLPTFRHHLEWGLESVLPDLIQGRPDLIYTPAGVKYPQLLLREYGPEEKQFFTELKKLLDQKVVPYYLDEISAGELSADKRKLHGRMLDLAMDVVAKKKTGAQAMEQLRKLQSSSKTGIVSRSREHVFAVDGKKSFLGKSSQKFTLVDPATGAKSTRQGMPVVYLQQNPNVGDTLQRIELLDPRGEVVYTPTLSSVPGYPDSYALPYLEGYRVRVHSRPAAGGEPVIREAGLTDFHRESAARPMLLKDVTKKRGIPGGHSDQALYAFLDTYPDQIAEAKPTRLSKFTLTYGGLKEYQIINYEVRFKEGGGNPPPKTVVVGEKNLADLENALIKRLTPAQLNSGQRSVVVEIPVYTPDANGRLRSGQQVLKHLQITVYLDSASPAGPAVNTWYVSGMVDPPAPSGRAGTAGKPYTQAK